MISKKDVEHIAKLSRLGFNEKEKESYQNDLASILGYVEKLNKVDTENIEPTSHITGLENFVREDEKVLKEDYKSLIEQAPDKEDNYFKVKAILR